MKNKKHVIVIVSIFALITMLLGASFAYFTPIIVGNDAASSHKTTSGSLILNYESYDYINMENVAPGESQSIDFYITNIGTLPINGYQINFSDLKNTFINDEVVFSLSCSSSDMYNCSEVLEAPVPKTIGLMLEQGSIAPETTHTYTLTVTFIEAGDNQNYNQEKEAIFKIKINEMEAYPSIMVARKITNLEGGGFNTVNELMWEYSEQITELTFESAINVPVNAIKSWDMSEANDGGIMAYIIDDGKGNSTYKLFIQSNGPIYASPNSSNLFNSFGLLEVINNITLFNTSFVNNMSHMFGYCYKLTSLDLSSFNTTNVTNMSYMFSDCQTLTTLNVSSFNTFNVENMDYMFMNCFLIVNLDLSSFVAYNKIAFSTTYPSIAYINPTPMVRMLTTSVKGMFGSCESLLNLDLRNFDLGDTYYDEEVFYGIPNGINIKVKDNYSQIWVNERLAQAGKTGNVTIH